MVLSKSTRHPLCLIRAAAIAAGALLLQWLIWPYIQPSPFVLLTLAILFAGRRGGWGPGLLAVVIITVGADVLFLPPAGGISASARDLLTMGLFAAVGVLTTWLNVAHQNAVQRARDRQEQLDTTLRSIGDAVIATDRAGRVRLLNEVAEVLTGWSSADALGRHLDEIFHIVNEATRERVESPVHKVIREGRVVGLANHTLLLARGGTEYVIEDSAAPIRDADGELRGIVMVFHDATLRWREDQRKAMLAEAGVVLASSLDHDETLARVARLAVPRFADWCAVHLVGDSGAIRLLAAAHADPEKVTLANELERRFPQLPHFKVGIPQVVRTGKSEWTREIPDEVLVMTSHDEEHLELLRTLGLRSYIIAPLRARGRSLGTVTFVTAESGRRYEEADVGFAEDFADRAAMAVDNARLYLEAKQAIRVRDEFLSVASHELKTPITALHLQLEVLTRSMASSLSTSGQLTRRMDAANRQILRLSSLVESLLDVSRITTGRMTLEREQVDLVELVSEVVEQLEHQARAAGCSVQVAVQTDRARGSWDRLRLEQVISNLLANALKYGAGTAVRIGIAEADGVARLTVRDEGIGIAEVDVERIFDRFERAVSPRHYGGLGLGLYIARQIVEAHGGEIRVTSKAGEGSEFTVLLPTDARDAEHPAAHPQ